MEEGSIPRGSGELEGLLAHLVVGPISAVGEGISGSPGWCRDGLWCFDGRKVGRLGVALITEEGGTARRTERTEGSGSSAAELDDGLSSTRHPVDATRTQITDLPMDMMSEIFARLPGAADVCAAAGVCFALAQAVRDERTWQRLLPRGWERLFCESESRLDLHRSRGVEAKGVTSALVEATPHCATTRVSDTCARKGTPHCATRVSDTTQCATRVSDTSLVASSSSARHRFRQLCEGIRDYRCPSVLYKLDRKTNAMTVFFSPDRTVPKWSCGSDVLVGAPHCEPVRMRVFGERVRPFYDRFAERRGHGFVASGEFECLLPPGSYESCWRLLNTGSQYLITGSPSVSLQVMAGSIFDQVPIATRWNVRPIVAAKGNQRWVEMETGVVVDVASVQTLMGSELAVLEDGGLIRTCVKFRLEAESGEDYWCLDYGMLRPAAGWRSDEEQQKHQQEEEEEEEEGEEGEEERKPQKEQQEQEEEQWRLSDSENSDDEDVAGYEKCVGDDEGKEEAPTELWASLLYSPHAQKAKHRAVHLSMF
ncbi:hypothetical protein CBR_g8677 [Chara braunii]|uniref:F-box domain-containing protein n=1 Tax=Chara braunii TaxID=69332 RepID=A0A388KMJ8_CHABU|nr:hypothetical protein CBR_g8677 [Chara braunii]|eukprot:GBG71255.1 hypothetical protein CBR_g8677 [Chara braunii]